MDWTKILTASYDSSIRTLDLDKEVGKCTRLDVLNAGDVFRLVGILQ